MSRRDQLVIDVLLLLSDATLTAQLRAHSHVVLIDHAALDRLLMRPSRLCVFGAPSAGRTVTRLALHAVFRIDMAGDQLRRNVRRMTIETERLFVRFPGEMHVAHDSRRAIVEENVIGLRMTIAVEPCVVLVL